jgi:hypothetical protein
MALLGVTLVAPRPALAQSSKASAEVLFSEGRRLMGEGKVDEACPKFADSQKLDPSSGTLLNLANCYEKLGRNASAWAIYQEAASLAASTQRADHLPVAQKRAAALLPLLAKVTVSISHPVEGLEVKRDGVPVARSEWGLAVPVDPGSHAYVAEAPGYKPARVSLTVPPTPEGGPAPSLILALPDLEKLPLATEKPAVVAPAGPVGPVTPPPSAWRPQRTVALVMGGVGLVGFGVAAGFAGLAKSTYNSSLPNCAPTDPSRCSLTGVNQRNDALQQGNIATGALAVGAAAAVAGIILWATAPEPKARVGFEISPGPGSVRVSGRW